MHNNITDTAVKGKAYLFIYFVVRWEQGTELHDVSHTDGGKFPEGTIKRWCQM